MLPPHPSSRFCRTIRTCILACLNNASTKKLSKTHTRLSGTLNAFTAAPLYIISRPPPHWLPPHQATKQGCSCRLIRLHPGTSLLANWWTWPCVSLMSWTSWQYRYICKQDQSKVRILYSSQLPASMEKQNPAYFGEAPPPARQSLWRRKRVWISELVLLGLVLFGVVFGAVYGVKARDE